MSSDLLGGRFPAALAAMGLPEPVQVVPLGQTLSHAHYRLRFADPVHSPDRLLRIQITSPGYSSLEGEWAALAALGPAPPIPVVHDYRMVPSGYLPRPAVVSAILPGVDARRWMTSGLGALVAREVGRVMAVLSEVELDGFGFHADGGRFLPNRSTWREEWAAWARGWAGRARGGGADFGPLTDQLEERLDDQLHALDTVPGWRLIHGDLHPGNLLVDPLAAAQGRLVLTGVVDWELAAAGDPLCEWAQVLAAPDGTLAYVVEGYGPERVRQLLEPEPLARMEAYLLGRCLLRTGVAVSPSLGGDGGRRRAHGLEIARRLSEEALIPDPIGTRLRRILEGTVRGPVADVTPPKATQVLIRRCLDALAYLPQPLLGGASSWLDAMACALLAEVQSVDVARRTLTSGQALADRLGPQSELRPWEPIPDREAWRAHLERRVTTGPRGWAQPALAWALQGLDRVGWSVGDPMLRGLESMVELLLGTDWDPPQWALRLLAEAAHAACAVLRGDEVGDGLAEVWTERHPVEAWDSDPAWTERVEVAADPGDDMRFTLVLALHLLGGSVPASPLWLVRAYTGQE